MSDILLDPMFVLEKMEFNIHCFLAASRSGAPDSWFSASGGRNQEGTGRFTNTDMGRVSVR